MGAVAASPARRMGKVLTIADVARRAGWVCESPRKRCRCKECEAGQKRMRRHLLTLDGQLGGMLLTKPAGDKGQRSYLVTLEAIERAHPEWFVQAETLEARVDELELNRTEMLEGLRLAHVCIGELRRQVAELEKGRDQQ